MRMATDTKRWTLEELHRLPDEGNKYEIVGGELYVTPAPYVAEHRVGGTRVQSGRFTSTPASESTGSSIRNDQPYASCGAE
jgi:hypothetical protein